MTPGGILKSKLRTEDHPLYVMVLHEYELEKSPTQFKGVVLADYGHEHKRGDKSNSWNKCHFEKWEGSLDFKDIPF